MNPVLHRMQTGENLRNHRHGLDTSADFALQVNGSDIFVEKYNSVSIGSFACPEPLEVRITCRKAVGHWRVLPRHRAPVDIERAGNTLAFRLSGPGKLWIEAGDLDPLLLFAEPPESGPPKQGASGVRYFGPGKHNPGMMELHDGETIYLAEGAYIYGGIKGGPRHARVLGRGVLDGSCLARPDKLILLTDARDVLVEGITVRNGPGWTCLVRGSRKVTFRNVKVISFGRNGDGINPVSSNDVTIEDCFFRCSDDCMAAKLESEPGRPAAGLERLTVRGCVMGGWLYADGFTIGFAGTRQHVRDVLVTDCDVLYARGNSGVKGHSAFSVILTGPTEVSNVRFADIRVEADVWKNFELNATGHTGEHFTAEQKLAEGGRIRGVHLRNIAWAAERPIILRGHDSEHLVEDVIFENCTVAGRKLTAVETPLFDVNEYVRGVRFV
jgi:hypothetical protein